MLLFLRGQTTAWSKTGSCLVDLYKKDNCFQLSLVFVCYAVLSDDFLYLGLLAYASS